MTQTLTPPTDLLKACPENTHQYITSYSGVSVRCPGMRSSMVRWLDMANSLAMQVRFLGHIKDFYSVADHLVFCSLLAEAYGEPHDVVVACFKHDIHEAYIGDFPSPFKRVVPGLKLFEHSVEAAVRDAVDLPADGDPIWARVKHYDLLALHCEAAVLFQESPEWVDPHILGLCPPLTQPIGHGWRVGKLKFLRRAHRLGIISDKMLAQGLITC